jgi:hypothetical protein
MTRIFNVLNLGAGVQSSRIALGQIKGELPKCDAWVFADTKWEPKAVYENVAWLKSLAIEHGVVFAQVTVGDLRQDAIDFRQARKSSDGKRYASIPTFIKRLDGKQGRVKRQCTREYKIDPIERWIKRELLGMKPRQRFAKDVLVRQWFGISSNEPTRATFPGRHKETKKFLCYDMHTGEPIYAKKKTWVPANWRHNVYPLLNEIWTPNRLILDWPFLPRKESRVDCVEWLAANYPGRTFPRSACLGCPFRDNGEWKDMRDNRPEEWVDACDFDDAQRQADHVGPGRRGLLVGVPYVHRQMVPLRMANLDGDGERKGAGCGSLHDGMDGLCDT